jgi:hypothetical protein
MKILFSTQSSSLQMFYNIARRMEPRYGLEPSIFITSDRAWHDGFAATEPGIAKRALLGEWTIADEARSAEIKQDVLSQYEDRYGETLWNAATCDRRFMSGWKSYFKNDYEPRCSEREILSRLQVACERIRQFFDEHAPTQLVGFTCVTYLEYLTVLEAKYRRIPMRNLRSVRVKNYVALDDGLLDPPSALKAAYVSAEYVPSPEGLAIARSVVETYRDRPMAYEGVAQPSGDKPAGRADKLKIPKGAQYDRDTHGSSTHRHRFERRFIHPVRASLMRRWVAKRYTTLNDLRSRPYAFFPLHLEPELALCLFSPAHTNQIEAARSLARALPAGYVLAIKDHPLGYNRRSISYYKKLLEIPNVRLVDPLLPAKEFVEGSQLIAIIGGSIGIEAALRGKPVLALSPCTPYGIMGDTGMVRHASDMNRIGEDLRLLLKNYRYDEEKILRYLAACVDTSVPLNLYSGLLQRSDALSFDLQNYESEVAKAAEFLWDSFLRPSKWLDEVGAKTSAHASGVKER